MENLILIFFTGLLIGLYLLGGFVAFLAIQFISYRVFKFNLYKKIMKLLEVALNG